MRHPHAYAVVPCPMICDWGEKMGMRIPWDPAAVVGRERVCRILLSIQTLNGILWLRQGDSKSPSKAYQPLDAPQKERSFHRWITSSHSTGYPEYGLRGLNNKNALCGRAAAV